MEVLLRAGVTAILFSNDLAALGGKRALQDHGVRVPDQVSVVGFDDLEISALVTPPLTTMSQPRFEMGRIATEVFLEILRGEVSGAPVAVTCTLVVRRFFGGSDAIVMHAHIRLA